MHGGSRVSLKEGGSFRCLNHWLVNKRNSNVTNWLVQMHSAWTNGPSASSCISNSAHLMLSTQLRALWSHTIFASLCFSSLWPSHQPARSHNIPARMERPYMQADIKYILLFFSPFLPEWSFDITEGLQKGNWLPMLLCRRIVTRASTANTLIAPRQNWST